MKDAMSATPPRQQKASNLLHIGFHLACKFPFFPNSAIAAAAAAPLATTLTITCPTIQVLHVTAVFQKQDEAMAQLSMA